MLLEKIALISFCSLASFANGALSHKSGFITLWAGIVPHNRTKRLVFEHVINSKEFWTNFPVEGFAKTELDNSNEINDWGCNWRGTKGIPANFMIMHVLLNYGYNDIAKQLAQKTLNQF